MNTTETNPSLLTDIWKFFKRPSIQIKTSPDSFFRRIYDFLRIFGLQLGIAILFGILITVVTTSLGYNVDQENLITDFFKDTPVIFFVLFGVVYAPIVEEITFRLFLKFSYIRLGIGISFMFFFILEILDQLGLSFLTTISERYFADTPILFIGLYILITLVFGIILAFIIKTFADKKLIYAIYDKYFIFIFYFTVLTFGFAHITNYTNLGQIWYIVPILVTPQISIGFFLGYVRVRYGLVWSIILHAIHNSFSTIPLILLNFTSDTFQNYLIEANTMSEEEILNSFATNDYVIIIVLLLFFIFIFLFVFVSIITMIVDLIVNRQSESSS